MFIHLCFAFRFCEAHRFGDPFCFGDSIQFDDPIQFDDLIKPPNTPAKALSADVPTIALSWYERDDGRHGDRHDEQHDETYICEYVYIYTWTKQIQHNIPSTLYHIIDVQRYFISCIFAFQFGDATHFDGSFSLRIQFRSAIKFNHIAPPRGRLAPKSQRALSHDMNVMMSAMTIVLMDDTVTSIHVHIYTYNCETKRFNKTFCLALCYVIKP